MTKFVPLEKIALTAVGCLIVLSACGNESTPTPATVPSETGSVAENVPTPLPTPFVLLTPTVVPTQPPPTAIPPTPEVVLHPESDTSYAIDLLLEGEQGVYGVVVIEPDGQVSYVKNSRLPFVSASLYKLLLLVDILRQVESGEMALSDELTLNAAYFPLDTEEPDSYYEKSQVGSTITIEDALFSTGAFSSNVSAAALLSLTDLPTLTETVQLLGLTQTYLQASPPDVAGWPPPILADSNADDTLAAQQFTERAAAVEPTSITTPMDMAIYFQLMLRGELIDSYVSQEVLQILEQQVVDDRFPYLLPPDTPLAHKTGNLDQVTHDVGIIVAPRGQVILAAMSEATPDGDRSTQIIQRLALIAYGTYDYPAFTEQAVMPTPGPGTAVAEEPAVNPEETP